MQTNFRKIRGGVVNTLVDLTWNDPLETWRELFNYHAPSQGASLWQSSVERSHSQKIVSVLFSCFHIRTYWKMLVLSREKKLVGNGLTLYQVNLAPIL